MSALQQPPLIPVYPPPVLPDRFIALKEKRCVLSPPFLSSSHARQDPPPFPLPNSHPEKNAWPGLEGFGWPWGAQGGGFLGGGGKCYWWSPTPCRPFFFPRGSSGWEASSKRMPKDQFLSLHQVPTIRHPPPSKKKGRLHASTASCEEVAYVLAAPRLLLSQPWPLRKRQPPGLEFAWGGAPPMLLFFCVSGCIFFFFSSGPSRSSVAG